MQRIATMPGKSNDDFNNYSRKMTLVQNCLKRGLGNVCAYPDPDTEQQHDRAAAPGMSALYADPK